MPDIFDGLGLNSQTPDVNSPLQVELAKAMMMALAPKQQHYDPNIAGGWTASMVNALGDIQSQRYMNRALRVDAGLKDQGAAAGIGQVLGQNTPENMTTIPKPQTMSEIPKQPTPSLDPSGAQTTGSINKLDDSLSSSGQSPDLAALPKLSGPEDDPWKAIVTKAEEEIHGKPAEKLSNRQSLTKTEIAPKHPFDPITGKFTDRIAPGIKPEGLIPNFDPVNYNEPHKKFNDRLPEGIQKLGGPKEDPGSEPPYQVAQNAGNRQNVQSLVPSDEITKTQNSPQGGQISVPGYSGSMPFIPYVTDATGVRAALSDRNLTADQRQVLVDKFKKEREPKIFNVPNGELHVDPVSRTGQFIASAKDVPFEVGGMSLMMSHSVGPDGKVQMQFKLPGSDGKSFNDLNSALDFARQQKVKDVQATGNAELQTKHYNDLANDTQSRSTAASANRQMLGIARNMVNDPQFYSGAGADRVMNVKKMMSILTGNPNNSGSIEAFEKIMAGANISGLEAFKGYGQIRNPEIELLRQSSGNLNNTPGALNAVIEINDRASKRLEEIGDMARQYKKEHGGTLDQGFDEKISNYYKARPLFNDNEVKNYRTLFSGHQRVEKPEDTKGMKPGTKIILPDGTEGVVPKE